MPTYVPILDAEVDAESPVTVSLMTRLRDNALSYLGASLATKMLFRQSSAPLGWTKDTTGYNHAMRVIGGTIADGGGLNFTTVFSRLNTDAFTITQSYITSILISLSMDQISPPNAVSTDANILKTSGGTSTMGGGGAVSFIANGAGPVQSTIAPFTPAGTGLLTGGGLSHAHGCDMRVLYLDFIMASKAA